MSRRLLGTASVRISSPDKRIPSVSIFVRQRRNTTTRYVRKTFLTRVRNRVNTEHKNQTVSARIVFALYANQSPGRGPIRFEIRRRRRIASVRNRSYADRPNGKFRDFPLRRPNASSIAFVPYRLSANTPTKLCTLALTINYSFGKSNRRSLPLNQFRNGRLSFITRTTSTIIQ